VIARHRLVLSLLGVGAVSSVLAFAAIGVGGPDDAYITDWVAQRFAETGRIVNYNDSPIEQSTSLLHVIVLGTARWVTRIPVPVLGYLVGFVALIATIVGVGLWTREINARAPLIAALLAAAAFPLLYWATSGLETLLVSALLLWFLLRFFRFLVTPDQVKREGILLGIVTLLLAGSRPDAILLVVGLLGLVVSVAFLGSRGPRFVSRSLPVVALRRSCLAAVPAGVAIGIVEGVRFALFDALVPQPVEAKTGSALRISAVRSGWDYLDASLQPRWLWIPVIVLAGRGVWIVFRSRSLAGWITVLTAALGVGIVVVSGGDWMGAARFLVPSLALLFVLAAIGIVSLRAIGRPHVTSGWRRLVSSPAPIAVATVLVLVLELAALSVFVRDASTLHGEWTFNNGSPVTDSFSLRVPPHGPSIDIPASIPWYQRRNAPHLRDAIFLDRGMPRIAEIIRRMPNPREQLTIGSGQAGLLPYDILDRFPGRVRFIDRGNLTTADFAKCPGRKHSTTGLVIIYGYWFKHAGECAPPMPDVIIDIGLFRKTKVLAQKYDLIYQQFYVIERKGLFPPFTAAMFLAVRKGFLPAVDTAR